MLKRWLFKIGLYLGFSKRETYGFFTLLLIICLIIILKVGFQKRDHQYLIGLNTEELRRFDSLADALNTSEEPLQKITPLKLSKFDPNTITSQDWKAMGLPAFIGYRLEKYRNAGGYFKNAEDLRRLYGWHDSLSRILAPYLVFKVLPSAPNFSKSYIKGVQPPEFKPFDINLADTIELETVYGIGNKRAKQIISHRDALGGFLNEDQYYEVWGLDSATVLELQKQSFVSNNFKPVSLNLNKVNEHQLRKHPYFGYKMAKLLVNYRNQHGLYHSELDLLKIKVLDSSHLVKWRPYINFEE